MIGIFDFFETSEQNSMKFDRKHDLNVIYQVCVFRADRKKQQHDRLSFWLAETYDFSSKLISTKLDRKQDLNFFSKVCVFLGRSEKKKVAQASDRKNNNAAWLLINWDIFDFSSEWNSTKLDRKQDLNVLYQVCVFRADRKKDDRSGTWLA